MSEIPIVYTVLLRANIANKNGNVYTEETLRNMADNKNYFYDALKKQLVLRHPISKEIQDKLKEGI
jgi:hypothetical protein